MKGRVYCGKFTTWLIEPFHLRYLLATKAMRIKIVKPVRLQLKYLPVGTESCH